MTELRRCPKCAAEIPVNSPIGLCPRCLMAAANDSQSAAVSAEPGPTKITPPASGFVPPTVEELAPQFPQLEILELLGKGGMGAVYKARQPGLDRLVAVKILPPEISHDPTFAERFQREARALARLSHPHIVAVYDFGQVRSDPIDRGAMTEPGVDRMNAVTTSAGGLYYIVMEFVDGANLRQTIQTEKLTPTEALAIVPQICEALQFAHDEGIVHRDIKPENILIDKRGRVKIADFGLAKLLNRSSGGSPESPSSISLTGTHQVMGTLRYMAPEQMQGSREVDHRADIYSLGVVFYELLTGELPMGRFAPPSKRVQVDVRLDEIVLRALEQDPEQRYQHASEVKSEIETISRTALPMSVPRVDSSKRMAPGHAGIANHAADPQVSEAAQKQIRRLGTWLLVAAVLYGFNLIGVIVWNGDAGPLVGMREATGDKELSERESRWLALIWLFETALAGGLLGLGSLKSKRRESYRLVVAACALPIVLTFVDCAALLLQKGTVNPADLLTLPIGVWGLIVLSRLDVKRVFEIPASMTFNSVVESPANSNESFNDASSHQADSPQLGRFANTPDTKQPETPAAQESFPYLLGWLVSWLLRERWVVAILQTVTALIYAACLIAFFSFQSTNSQTLDGSVTKFEVGQPSAWLTLQSSRSGQHARFEFITLTHFVALFGLASLAVCRWLERRHSDKAHSMVWHYVTWVLFFAGVSGFGLMVMADSAQRRMTLMTSTNQFESLPSLNSIANGIGAEFTIPAGHVATFEIVTRSENETVPLPSHGAYLMAAENKPITGQFRWTWIRDEVISGNRSSKWRIEMFVAGGSLGHTEPSHLLAVYKEMVGTRPLTLGLLEPNEEVIHWGTTDANNLPANGLIGLRVAVVPHGLKLSHVSGIGSIDWKKAQTTQSTTRRKLP